MSTHVQKREEEIIQKEAIKKPSRKPQRENSYSGWIITSVVILGATLPFHYVPEQMRIFPKDNLTFSNTFIFQHDINKVIDRYNSARPIERQAINQEPLVRKLREKGIIVDK